MKRKNTSVGRKKEARSLLLCERIYCFAQKLIVQQQHDSKRSLLHHNVFGYETIPVILNEVNGKLGNETRVRLIVKLLLSYFIQRIGIGKSFGFGTSLQKFSNTSK